MTKLSRVSLLVLSGGLLLIGCGAKTGLDDGCEAVDWGPDEDLTESTLSRCDVHWTECRPVGVPITVEASAIDLEADLVWNGRELLALTSNVCGATVTGVDLDGAARWQRHMDHEGPGRIAWNERSRAGLVALRGAIFWLDSSGEPSGDAGMFADGDNASRADVFALGEGFGLLTGPGRSSVPGGFRAVRFASIPAHRASFEVIDTGFRADRLPEHAVDDEGATSFAAASWGTMDGGHALWDLSSGSPEEVEVSYAGHGALLRLAMLGDQVFSLGALGPIEDDPGLVGAYVIWLSLWSTPGQPGRGDVFVLSPGLGRAELAMESVGGRLFVASELIHPDGVLSFAMVDTVTARDDLGPLFPLVTPEVTVRAPHMTRTPRGAAIAWAERNGSGTWAIHVQRIDCCAE